MIIDVDWPLWPRQRQALESVANDQLFGGASEGGKSYFGRVSACCAGMQCEGLQMTLIRKKYEDILTNHLEGDKGLRALLYPLSSKGVVEVTEKRIRFPKGNVLNFKHCQDERQFDSAQGNENQIVIVDEAPQIKKRLILAFRGWCRMTPEHLKRQPPFWQKKLPWILQTGNPVGASVGYFRESYVKARAPFSIEEVAGFRRQYIPSRAEDNRSVDLRIHQERLSAIGDAELARALDLGDWDASVGDFIREYNDDIHAVPDFTPPAWWLKWRAFDWGKAEPFCVLWLTVSDGEPFKDELGRDRWFPRGAVIVYREWYGCDPAYPHIGSGLTNLEICRGIQGRTPEVTSGITLTDNLPFQRRDDELMADFYAKNGVPLTLGITDRVMGWARIKDMLSGINDIPMLYIVHSCRYLRDYLPALQRHELKMEDAVDHGETTHAPDTLRVGISSRPAIRTQPKSVLPQDYQSAKVSMSADAILRKLKKRETNSGRRL